MYFDFSTTIQNTLIYHYNGTKWSQISTPNMGKTSENRSGIAINPKNGNTWTVDSGYSGSFQQTSLVEKHSLFIIILLFRLLEAKKQAPLRR